MYDGPGGSALGKIITAGSTIVPGIEKKSQFVFSYPDNCMYIRSFVTVED